ncbi:MAG: hypothetical protein E6I39_07710 [Chloroflexi bacterium]|nr:MAG: hypothetical protein E6J30_10800 [Chloroflexota bacterium]TMD21241.1 MAG: hypothetical protein E6I98_02840 [Chloroflexota bacterium]TME99470.1 MAG: hypothetical protein E6I39_07710 [Chloroflexota bacterium]
MIGLGNNVHVFAKPHRREAMRHLFEDLLQCGPVVTIEHPGMAEPMLIVRFPEGGSLSIEFTPDASDSEEPRLATWLELRTQEPITAIDALRSARIREVKHPGHPFYFMAPGGLVFTIVSATP